MVHPAAWPTEELLAKCDVATTRRSGPGGQHRNKVETAVVIVHLPTGIRAEASERRSQVENREQAVFRLRLGLAHAWREPSSPVPTSLFQARTHGTRILISDRHSDYPAILAEVLDALYDLEQDVGLAAKQLGISNSQLLKIVRLHGPSWQRLNQVRLERGQHPLQ